MSAKLAPASAARGDTRTTSRHPCEVQTTCQPPSAWSKDPWPAVIRDISTGGVCLALDRRFERGSGLAIELPAEDGTSSTVLARVAHLRPQPGGGWLLGCRFVSELSEEEVQQVLVTYPGRDSAQGVGPARPETINGVLFQAKLRPGVVLRWYVKRLDLTASWPPAHGKEVSLRVAGLPDTSPPIRLLVKRCKVHGSFWVLDGKFAVPPSEEALRALQAPGEAVE